MKQFMSLLLAAAIGFLSRAGMGIYIHPSVIDRVNRPEAWASVELDPEKKILDVWIANIRDADAILVCYDGSAWMIDCGDKRSGIRTAEMLRQLGITELGRVINSHPHNDHLLGMPWIDEAASIGELWICFPEKSTEHMVKAMDYCREKGIPVRHFSHGDVFTMGDGAVTWTFWQNPDERGLNMNCQSAITKIEYGKRSILMLADMDYLGQKRMMELIGEEPLRCDLFKYPHHGKMAMRDSFFEAMGAQAAIITNYQGVNEVRTYLGYKHYPQIYTNKAGVYTHLRTDGETWICEYVPIEP